MRRKAEEDAVADLVRNDVKVRVLAWSKDRSTAMLLRDLPLIVPWLADDLSPLLVAVSGSAAGSVSPGSAPSASDIKKTYHKVARLLHPDSQKARLKDLSVDQRLTHEHVFAVIAQKMQG